MGSANRAQPPVYLCARAFVTDIVLLGMLWLCSPCWFACPSSPIWHCSPVLVNTRLHLGSERWAVDTGQHQRSLPPIELAPWRRPLQQEQLIPVDKVLAQLISLRRIPIDGSWRRYLGRKMWPAGRPG